MNILNRALVLRSRRSRSHGSRAVGLVERLEDRTLFAAGAIDPTFGSNGLVTLTSQRPTDVRTVAAAALPGGKTLLLGTVPRGPYDGTFALTRLNADGSPDATFSRDGTIVELADPGNDGVTPLPVTILRPSALAVDGQGRIYVAGTDGFLGYLARLTADGSADPTFATGGLAWGDDYPDLEAFSGTLSIGLTPDGGVVVGGASGGRGLRRAPNRSYFTLARFDGNGQSVQSFGTGGVSAVAFRKAGRNLPATLQALAVDADGRILAAGGGAGYLDLARFDANGLLDPSFGTGGAVRIQGQRSSMGMSSDPRSGSAFETLAVRASDGAVFAAGPASSDGPLLVAAFTADGLLDRGFGRRGVTAAAFPSVSNAIAADARGLAPLADGSVIVSATLGSDGVLLAKLGANGTPDATFGAALAAPPVADAPAGWRYVRVTRPAGDFVPAGAAAGLAVADDGSTVTLPVRGGINQSVYAQPTALRLRTADGSLDRGFGRNGVAIAASPAVADTESARFLAVDGNGDILVDRQHSETQTVSRIDAAGATDDVLTAPAFLAAGAVGVQRDGKVLAQARAADGTAVDLLRYNADGTLDATFGDAGHVRLPAAGHDAWVFKLLQRAEGSFAVDVRSDLTGPVLHDYQDRLFNVTAGGVVTGQVDLPMDGAASFPNTAVKDLALAPNGAVLAAMWHLSYGGPNSAMVARYRADDLSLDTAFGSGGNAALPSSLIAPTAIAVFPDGRIVVGRVDAGEGTVSTLYLAVLTPAGTPDTSFGPNGDGTASMQVPGWSPIGAGDLLAEADGKILALGHATDAGAQVVRLLADGSPDASFGTNGVVTVGVAGTSGWVSVAALQETSGGEKLLLAGSILSHNTAHRRRPPATFVERLDL